MLLKTYGQSFVRGEITHSSRARDTGAFVLSVCVRTRVYRARKREIERENCGEEKGERGAKRSERKSQGTTLSRD